MQPCRPANSGALGMLLDSVVADAMARATVPGVAVGVRVATEEMVAGYGVTSVEDPLPVHGETLFQIGSVWGGRMAPRLADGPQG